MYAGHKNYTMQSLLNELDIIEYYQQPGKSHHLSEITENQRKLYEAMDVITAFSDEEGLTRDWMNTEVAEKIEEYLEMTQRKCLEF